MNLQQFKDEIKKTKFYSNTNEVIDKILTKAIKRGKLLEDEKRNLAEIINLEYEVLNVEAEAIKNIKERLNEYNRDLEKTAEQASREIENLDKKFSDNINNIVNQFKIARIREKIKKA